MSDPTPAPLADADAPTDAAPPQPSDEDAPPDTAGIPVELVRRYKDLRLAEKAADAEKGAYKAEADAIEAQLVEAFGEAGTQSINLDGRTVFLQRTTFAQRINGADADDVKAALHASGAGDLVTETVNAQTLSAWVRELVGDDDNPGPGLPEPAAAVLELGEKFNIRVNAATRKKAAPRKKASAPQ